MALTPQQLPTLKAAIAAETDLAFVALRQSGATGAMSDWYNQPHASVKGWNKSAPWSPVYNSIDGAKYTPSLSAVAAAPDATATKQLLVNLIKLTVQQNMLLALQTVDARDGGNVDALLDTVTAVYTLSGNNTVSPGGASGVIVATQLTRPALRGEALYGGSDVTKGTVSAKILTYEGTVTNQNVIDALALP